jgi:DNA-binding NtrC family response regulator
MDAGAPDFADELLLQLKRVLHDRERRQAEDEALIRLFACHDVIGQSPAMRDVFRRALKANRFQDLPVVIEGEKGTPKYRLAAAILYLDPDRIRQPFFALSCLGLGRVLGNLPGQVSASTEQWQQLLRAAQGGTLFLDEIGALDRELQPLLLAAAGHSADLRVIVATDRPVAELVEQGVLDADLADLLGVFRIPLPSLRGRPEDIAAQAEHTLLTLHPDAEFGPGVLEALQRLPWEGNTMQLEAVLRQALEATGEGTTLRLDDLPSWVAAARLNARMPQLTSHPGDWSYGLNPLDTAADEYERRLLWNLLERQEMGEVQPDHVFPD